MPHTSTLWLLPRANDGYQLQEMPSRDVKFYAMFENQIRDHHVLLKYEVRCMTMDLGWPAHLVPTIGLHLDVQPQLLASDQLAMGREVLHVQLQWCALRGDHVLQRDRGKSFRNRRSHVMRFVLSHLQLLDGNFQM